MAITLIDSYNESNANGMMQMYTGTVVKGGQSFTNTYACTLSSCKFRLAKGGSPTGDVYAKLYAHTGTYGTTSEATGDALATSEAVAASSLPGGSGGLVEFTFTGANQVSLLKDTYYFISAEYSGGDSSNNVEFWVDTSPGHSGNFARYISDWSAQSYDAPFYVYGDRDYPTVGEGYPLTAFGNV